MATHSLACCLFGGHSLHIFLWWCVLLAHVNVVWLRSLCTPEDVDPSTSSANSIALQLGGYSSIRQRRRRRRRRRWSSPMVVCPPRTPKTNFELAPLRIDEARGLKRSLKNRLNDINGHSVPDYLSHLRAADNARWGAVGLSALGFHELSVSISAT